MRKETIFVGLACLLGAFIGAWISIELSTLYAWSYALWPIGSAFGGVVGYLSYDPKGLWSGAQRAWKEVIAWRPDYAEMKNSLLMLSAVLCVIVSALLYVFFPMMVLSLAVVMDEYDEVVVLAAGSTGCLGIVIGLSLLYTWIASVLEGKYLRLTSNDIREIKRVIFWLNPILAPFTLLRWTYDLLSFCLRHLHVPFVSFYRAVILFAGTTRRLLWMTFKYVHSDQRKLCLVDAAIGAAVGFFFGNPLIGGLVGCLLGIVNFELVSVRWLNLVPSE